MKVSEMVVTRRQMDYLAVLVGGVGKQVWARVWFRATCLKGVMTKHIIRDWVSCAKPQAVLLLPPVLGIEFEQHLLSNTYRAWLDTGSQCSTVWASLVLQMLSSRLVLLSPIAVFKLIKVIMQGFEYTNLAVIEYRLVRISHLIPSDNIPTLRKRFHHSYILAFLFSYVMG